MCYRPTSTRSSRGSTASSTSPRRCTTLRASSEYHCLSPSSRLPMSRSFLHRAGAALVLAGVAAACGGRIHSVTSAEPVPAAVSTLDRMTVRTGEQAVVVDSPAAAGRRVERMVRDAGGYLERSSGSSDGNVQIEARVPAAQLHGLMDSVG